MNRVVLISFGASIVALWPRHAEAQTAVDWQGSATADIGVTTNVANTPVPAKNAPYGTDFPHWDGFGDLSPAIQLNLQTKRTTHVFSYIFNYRYYFENPRSNVVANTFAYGFGSALSSTVDYAMGITLAQTQLSAFNNLGPAQGTQTVATVAGNSFIFTGVANQSLHVAVSTNNVFAEGLAFTANHTIPVAGENSVTHVVTPAGSPYETYVASGTLDLTHQFKRDTLGGQLGTDALIFPEQQTLTTTVPSHIDIVHRLTLDWHHEFNPEWSSTLDAGVLAAYQANAPKTPAIQPAGSAAIEYGTERGTAGLTYTHAAQPNLITQQLALVDTIALRGGLPIYGSGFDIAGTAAGLASRGLLLDVGGFTNVTWGILGDAALGYTKETLPLRFELRYQIMRQFPFGHQIASQPAVLDIRRQNLLFSITAYFPHPPAVTAHGPSLVGIPSPGSNPDIIGRQDETRGQMEDKDREDAHDRREERSKKSDSGGGGEAPAGDSK